MARRRPGAKSAGAPEGRLAAATATAAGQTKARAKEGPTGGSRSRGRRRIAGGAADQRAPTSEGRPGRDDRAQRARIGVPRSKRRGPGWACVATCLCGSLLVLGDGRGLLPDGKIRDLTFGNHSCTPLSCPAARGDDRHSWPSRGPWIPPVFDRTLGFEGEGPGGRITIATINPTSWNAQAHNLLMTPAHLLLVQETRIARDDKLRGARAAARREAYWGHWTLARKTAAAGSGGLATLAGAPRPYRAVKPAEPGPHWLDGRWSHTAVWVDQEVLHVLNVYGWPTGTPDHKARQAQMWAELFGYIAGLGRAPWIAAGDWNTEPHELWANIVVGRTGGC